VRLQVEVRTDRGGLTAVTISGDAKKFTFHQLILPIRGLVLGELTSLQISVVPSFEISVE